MADKKKITLLLICLFIIGILTSACGDSNGIDNFGSFTYDPYGIGIYQPEEPVPVPTPTSTITIGGIIHLSQKIFSMNVNQVEYITVKLGDIDVTNSARFVQNNNGIATVEKGKITALEPGTTIVSVYVDGAITNDHFVITVLDPTLPTLEVSQSEFNLGIGDTENVIVKLNGKDVTESVTYTSDDTNIATCEKGLITAEQNEGTAEIIVSYEGANDVEFIVNVTDDSDEDARLNSDVLNKLGIDKNATEITIPAVYIDGNKKYKITSIEQRTFMNCHNLTNINLPETITDIGEGTFYGCSSLKSIKIPNKVTTIKRTTFGWCHSLETIELPSHLEKIGDYAFEDCTSLQEINIPDSVSSIGKWAFNLCTSLKEIEIPDKIKIISNHCLFQCTSLKEVTLPKNLEKIEEYAFGSCRSLELTIPDNVSEIENYAFNNVKHIYYTNNLKANTSNAPWGAKAKN